MGDVVGNAIPWYLPQRRCNNNNNTGKDDAEVRDRRPSAGRLHVITGPMFAKKTTMLISRLHDLNEEGYRVLYINSKKDKLRCKDNQPFSTHNTSMTSTRITRWENRTGTESSTIHGKMVSKLMHPKIEAMCEEYDVIGIDEAQFFDGIYEFCEKQLKKNRYIIVTGLDSNFEMKPFASVVALAALSESFVKVPAVCRQCRDEQANDGQPCRAYFTRRIVPTTTTSDGGSTIDPGGKEKYEAVCRRHHTIPSKQLPLLMAWKIPVSPYGALPVFGPVDQ